MHCLPIAPEGWRGPSAVYDGVPLTPAPPCGGNYPVPEVEDRFHLGETEPATCGCEVVKPKASKCVINVKTWTGPDCTGTQALTSLFSGDACMDLTSSAVQAAATKLTGTCSPPNAVPTLPPPNRDRQILACGLAQAAVCEGRPDCTAAPLPLPPAFTRLCIHHDGDVPCPEADYVARAVVTRVVDTRGCSACTSKLVGDCRLGVERFTAAACGGAPQTLPLDGVCVNVAAMKSIRYASEPRCESTSTPTGGLEARDPVTFCCSR